MQFKLCCGPTTGALFSVVLRNWRIIWIMQICYDILMQFGIHLCYCTLSCFNHSLILVLAADNKFIFKQPSFHFHTIYHRGIKFPTFTTESLLVHMLFIIPEKWGSLSELSQDFCWIIKIWININANPQQILEFAPFISPPSSLLRPSRSTFSIGHSPWEHSNNYLLLLIPKNEQFDVIPASVASAFIIVTNNVINVW